MNKHKFALNKLSYTGNSLIKESYTPRLPINKHLNHFCA